jgi:hypothetical protein
VRKTQFACLLVIVSLGALLLAGCGESEGSGESEGFSGTHMAHSQIERHRAAMRRARMRQRAMVARRHRREAARRHRAEMRQLRAEEVERRAAEEEAAAEEESSECDPNYSGACLDPYASDYDCEGGSGNGPEYTGTVTVVGEDHYGLDSDSDGVGCEPY